MIVMLLKINYITYMFIRIYYTNFHKTEDDKIENCILTMRSTFIWELVKYKSDVWI
jgi:hypothetical protein